MDYQSALDYILSFTNYEKIPGWCYSADFDLRRVEDLLARLGNPHLAARSVHVAGTKGKGSTATMIAAVLGAAGYRVGLYTSPHLHTLRERICVGGSLISEEEVSTLIEKLLPQVDAVNHHGTYGQLTTFEILTALAFAYFEKKRVEFQVLEVGLGGRLDATNVVHPDVCVITPISLDHTEVLGDSLAAIAAEKSGIIKPGSTVVSSLQPPEAMAVIKRVCLQKRARLVRVGSDITWQKGSFDLSGQTFQVEGRKGSYHITLPLLGDHQLENAATAVAVIESLSDLGFSLPPESIAAGMAGIRFPGRLQILRHHPMLVVDGAHNADSARRLKEAIVKYFAPERLVLIMGVSLDKDVAGIAEELLPLSDTVIVTRSGHPRSISPDILTAEFSRWGVKAVKTQSVASAIEYALGTAGERDLICVTGSLFVVAEAIEYVNQLGNSHTMRDISN